MEGEISEEKIEEASRALKKRVRREGVKLKDEEK